MNKRMMGILLVLILIISTLLACGNKEENSDLDASVAETTQSITQTQDTQKEEDETLSTFFVSGNVSTDKTEKPTEKPGIQSEEEPKKNVFETIVDTVIGWFDKEDQKPADQQPTTENNTQIGTNGSNTTQDVIQEGTRPMQDTQPEQENTQPPEPTQDTEADGGELTYEEYLALSPAERMTYYESFGDPEAFTLWFQAAKDAYESGDAIEIGGGSIELTP